MHVCAYIDIHMEHQEFENIYFPFRYIKNNNMTDISLAQKNEKEHHAHNCSDL